jgi:predicted metal-dependent hydrolase/CheY-like chemotaxis protein
VPGLVLVLEDDLLFSPRIEMGLQASGYRARFVTQISELNEALKAAPVLILANIGARGLPWPKMVELAQARRLPPHAPVVGYGPHTDLELRQKALDAGCDAVVARSAVANNMASLLQRHAWKPDLSACDRPLPAGVMQGIEQFNQRQFYQCHDSVELVWVDEPGDVRLMYQGLLQISVAFYHVQQGNWRGMVKMLARGKGKLLPFLPVCQGVDVGRLLADAEQCESVLKKLGPERMAELDPDLFPVITAAE